MEDRMISQIMTDNDNVFLRRVSDGIVIPFNPTQTKFALYPNIQLRTNIYISDLPRLQLDEERFLHNLFDSEPLLNSVLSQNCSCFLYSPIAAPASLIYDISKLDSSSQEKVLCAYIDYSFTSLHANFRDYAALARVSLFILNPTSTIIILVLNHMLTNMNFDFSQYI